MQTIATISTIHSFHMPPVTRFGADALRLLPEEIVRLGGTNIALVSDKGLEAAGLVRQVEELLAPLGLPVVTYTELAGEPSFRTLAEALALLKSRDCDIVIGVGGGSAMDVAKTVAALLDKDDPAPYMEGSRTIDSRRARCILLPTTSGTGAEVTMNAIFADIEKEVKRGLVSPVLLPDVAIVDPCLTLSCPPKVTAASGVDALTHAMESYIAVRATPQTRMYAEQAMRLFPQHIAAAVHHGSNLEARIGMSMVSHYAGIALANAGVGAVHALAYPLGGRFHVEHGVANALLLPYVFEVIGCAVPERMVEIAACLQLGDYTLRPQDAPDVVVRYLYRLLRQLDLPSSLAELGIDERSLPPMAEQAAAIDRLLSNTPYRLKPDKILRIYQQAYAGK